MHDINKKTLIFFLLIIVTISVSILKGNADVTEGKTTKNVIINYFYNELDENHELYEAVVKANELILKIQEEYNNTITVNIMQEAYYHEEFEKYEEINSIPSCVIINTTNGYYTIINYNDFTEENLRSAIEKHIKGDYNEHHIFNIKPNYMLIITGTILLLILISGFLIYKKITKNKP